MLLETDGSPHLLLISSPPSHPYPTLSPCPCLTGTTQCRQWRGRVVDHPRLSVLPLPPVVLVVLVPVLVLALVPALVPALVLVLVLALVLAPGRGQARPGLGLHHRVVGA